MAKALPALWATFLRSIVKKWASSQKRLHLWPFARLASYRIIWGFTDYLDKNGYDENTKLEFLWLRRSIHQYTSTIPYDANYVIVFYPKQGTMHKLYLAKGWYENPLWPFARVHLEAQNDDFFQINTPIWVSIDLNGHSHKTIQYSSIWKPCIKGMPSQLACTKTCASFATSPTENENKHACCFCSTKLGSHWNSAALAPIKILHQLCSASAPIEIRFRSSSALWPLNFAMMKLPPAIKTP